MTISSRLACQLLQHFHLYLSCRHLLWAIVSADIYPVLLFHCGFPRVVRGDFHSMSRRYCHLKGGRKAKTSTLIILVLMLEAL